MQLNEPVVGTPNLQEAINYHPLVLTPDTSLVEVIARLSQIPSCALGGDRVHHADIEKKPLRQTCALIMQEEDIVGILTERDIVRFAAAGMNCNDITAADVMAHPVKTLSLANFKDIFAVMFLFRRYRIRHLPIVDDQNKLVGITEPSSLRQVLRPANLLKLRRVSEVMSTAIIHAPPNCLVLSLAKLMAEHRVSCVVIVEPAPDDGLKPIGIVTERDIVQFQAMQCDIGKMTAIEVMSSPLFLLNPEDSLWSAHQEMQHRRVRRLVVSWNWGQDLGIVTQTSLLKVFDPLEMYGIIETLQQTIQQLEAEKKAYWHHKDAEVG